MSGAQLRKVRERLGWTQEEAAQHWKMSQPFLSLLENSKRRVPNALAEKLVRDESASATILPLEVQMVNGEDLPRLLGSLAYPGFAYLAKADVLTKNPATVLLAGLRQTQVPARVTEAFPWLLITFADLDWDWLVDQAKLANVQNRLGYLVRLALDLTQRRGDAEVVTCLLYAERKLEDARLAKEDTLGRALTDAERRYFRDHRPEAAAHWNLLTSLRAEDLRYAI